MDYKKEFSRLRGLFKHENYLDVIIIGVQFIGTFASGVIKQWKNPDIDAEEIISCIDTLHCCKQKKFNQKYSARDWVNIKDQISKSYKEDNAWKLQMIKVYY